MPELSQEESKEFAREYAKVFLEENAHVLDDKIEKIKLSSIRDITKFITSEAREILINESVIPSSPCNETMSDKKKTQ
jgi:hypothetical protein